MDQDKSVYTQEELLVSLVLNASTMYGYFIRDRRGLFSSALSKRFGAPQTVEDMPYWMIKEGNVAPASVRDWLALFAAIDRGDRSGSALVALKSDEGGYGRYWLRFDVVSDENGEPFLALITSDNFTPLYRQFRLKDNDISALIHATQRTYPEILTLDLTQGSCRVIHYDDDAIEDIPESGRIEDMIRMRLCGVYPEDREGFAGAFSVKRLRRAFMQDGEESVQAVYRRPGPDGRLYWMETTVMRQDNAADSNLLLVAMTRNVDARVAEEIRLKEQLRLQEEELRLTLSQMGKVISYYDVAASTLTTPAPVAAEKGIPAVVDNFPECLREDGSGRFPPESLEAICAFFEGIRAGRPAGSCEYRVMGSGKKESWFRLEYASIFDGGKRPIRAVVALENITSGYAQAQENQRLKANEYLLRLTAQHSERIVCHYDIKKQSAEMWDGKACAKCRLPRLCETPASAILGGGDILPESIEKAKGMFQDIEAGKPHGELKLRVRVKDGGRRWFDVKYSTVFDEDGEAVSAIISHKDITEEYERELAYQRYVQSIEFDAEGHLMYIESDLTADSVEKVAGHMVKGDEREIQCSHSDFGRLMLDMKFVYEAREAASEYFSCANLLEQYAQGKRHMVSEWQVRFEDGSLHWLDTSVSLMADPYNGHVKAFFRMMDVTHEKQELLAIQQRSERDGMTGLLNRATAEEWARSLIAEKKRPGILVLLDLDDLKGINDTFGHSEGDRAILGIAETLKAHFRDSDIIGRIGGDEFLVYLPGAADKSDSIAVSLTSLLRKLSGISIGSGDERRMHCSVGCAVQSSISDTYESLFKQADTALYHVKRNGKNNFAFYVPEMDQEDYRFQAKMMLSQQSKKKFELTDLQYLLSSIASFYQLVLSVNLSSNDYYLMEEVRDGVFAKVPAFGALNGFVLLASKAVHPDDVAGYFDALSRKALLDAYERGAKNVRHYFRFLHNGEYRWIEGIVIFYTSERGDVCDFTLLRWADERALELERLWLQKVLELAVVSSFEYVCLVNLDSGEYTLYGDGKNTHGVASKGNFDDVTRQIRDNLIPPSERDEYYRRAKLGAIEERMREADGYSYAYNLPDGPRQAAFHWFEPTHTQVLMTVQRR